MRPYQGFGGTGEQGHLFQGNRGTNAIFQGNRGTSSEIWGTGEHKILCAIDIKYCYKEPFFISRLAKAKFQFSSWSLQNGSIWCARIHIQ